MSFFPFIESIFYLSLGIIVILIFLIVFHFKQRIESLEKKGFLSTDMYNNLIKEINIIKTVVYSPPVIQQKQNILFSTESIPPNEPTTSYNKIIVMDKLSEVDDESNLDPEFESDSEYEETDLEPELDDLEVIELDNHDKLKEDDDIKEIDNLEEKNDTSIHVTKIDSELEPENIAPPPPPTASSIAYSKMGMNELKMLVITKGLSTNPNKLKKSEILKLLEEETI